ncbi:MAG: lipoyl(octanoyl) transferase LipB [Chloroflexi bacterium]|nr:lipoyl(octanoyl) transferase LipB [Chloroflexota bacterium]
MSTRQRYDCALVDLGSVPYHEAWELQRRLVAARQADVIPDVVLLLEHPHTYTIGRRGDDSEVLATPEHLHTLGATVVEVDRGGLATYHGPGQLVGYPILDLRPRGRAVHSYLRNLEEALINTLREIGIPAQRVAQKTGVWVDDRKIASIGVRFSRWISSHGFALNVTTDLSYFSHIVPCGMPTVTMTSVAQESSVSQGSTVARETGKADMALIRERIAHHLAQVFDLQYVKEFSPALAEHLATLDESQVMALR